MVASVVRMVVVFEGLAAVLGSDLRKAELAELASGGESVRGHVISHLTLAHMHSTTIKSRDAPSQCFINVKCFAVALY